MISWFSISNRPYSKQAAVFSCLFPLFQEGIHAALPVPYNKPQKMEVCTAEEIPLKIAGDESKAMPCGIESLYLTF